MANANKSLMRPNVAGGENKSEGILVTATIEQLYKFGQPILVPLTLTEKKPL